MFVGNKSSGEWITRTNCDDENWKAKRCVAFAHDSQMDKLQKWWRPFPTLFWHWDNINRVRTFICHSLSFSVRFHIFYFWSIILNLWHPSSATSFFWHKHLVWILLAWPFLFFSIYTAYARASKCVRTPNWASDSCSVVVRSHRMLWTGIFQHTDCPILFGLPVWWEMTCPIADTKAVRRASCTNICATNDCRPQCCSFI